MTDSLTIRSTASYMGRFHAPEEVEGRVLRKERDVWSLGCLCYEAFVSLFVRVHLTNQLIKGSFAQNPILSIYNMA
jgi:serine/threonine protein kinase